MKSLFRSKALHFIVLVAVIVVASVGTLGIPKVRAQVTDSADSLTLRLAHPLSFLRDAKRGMATTALASTKWTEFPVTDIPRALQNANNAQELVAVNRDTANIVCVEHLARNLKLVDGGPTQDCAKLLDAGITFDTCADSVADGGVADGVAPGQSQAFPIAGDDCIFVRAGTGTASARFSLVAR